jgi:hypothetical protein
MDEAFRRQPDHGFPDRRTRHAEPPHQRGLIEIFARQSAQARAGRSPRGIRGILDMELKHALRPPSMIVLHLVRSQAARSKTNLGRGLGRRHTDVGATIRTNKRSISADDFFKGLFSTALDDGEIIAAVSFPVQAKAGYSKFPDPALRFCPDRGVPRQDPGR